MPGRGRRYLLALYPYLLDRWWRLTLWIGAILLVLAAGLAVLPILLPQIPFLWTPDWLLWALAGAGAYALILSIFLISIRKLAYLQTFPDHLRLVTPFLRLNISYRRILQASSVDMQHLFPIEKSRGWRRKFLGPMGGRTAIVLEMRGWPLPRWLLRLFLSPFFFPDKSPRLALLVPKWMEFSTELETARSIWLESQRRPVIAPQTAVLNSFSRSRK